MWSLRAPSCCDDRVLRKLNTLSAAELGWTSNNFLSNATQCGRISRCAAHHTSFSFLLSHIAPSLVARWSGSSVAKSAMVESSTNGKFFNSFRERGSGLSAEAWTGQQRRAALKARASVRNWTLNFCWKKFNPGWTQDFALVISWFWKAASPLAISVAMAKVHG